MGKCYNKIELNQPIDSVWQEVSDFHDMSWASGVVTSLQKVGAVDGHHVGAKRVINDAFHETLVEYNDDAHRFAYHIDDGPGPVSQSVVQDYVGVVQLTETDNGQGDRTNRSKSHFRCYSSLNRLDLVCFEVSEHIKM